MSIKNHKPIDIASYATLPDGAGIPLRAKLWDPNKDGAATTVKVTLGVYTKKVNGALVQVMGADAPLSDPTPLVLDVSDVNRKVKDYRGTAVLKGDGQGWTGEELLAVGAELDPGEKAYVCISSIEVSPSVKYSTKVNQRLGNKGKAVRDCVKVIDSTPTS